MNDKMKTKLQVLANVLISGKKDEDYDLFDILSLLILINIKRNPNKYKSNLVMLRKMINDLNWENVEVNKNENKKVAKKVYEKIKGDSVSILYFTYYILKKKLATNIASYALKIMVKMENEQVVSAKQRKAEELIAQAESICASLKKAYRLPEKPETFQKLIKKYGLGFDKSNNQFFYYDTTPLGMFDYSSIARKFDGKTPLDSLLNAIRAEEHIFDSLTKNMKTHKDMLEDLAKYNKNPSVNILKYVNNRVKSKDRKLINVLIGELSTIDRENKQLFDKTYKMLQEAVEGYLEFLTKQMKAIIERRKFTRGLENQIKKNVDFFNKLFGLEQTYVKEEVDMKLVNELKKVITKKQTVNFMYDKADGSRRVVNVKPSAIKNTSKGFMMFGFDLDRNANRSYFVGNISNFNVGD